MVLANAQNAMEPRNVGIAMVKATFIHQGKFMTLKPVPIVVERALVKLAAFQEEALVLEEVQAD